MDAAGWTPARYRRTFFSAMPMRLRRSYITVACATIASALAIVYIDRAIVLALNPGYRHSAVWTVVDEAFKGIEPVFACIAIAGAWFLFTSRGRRTTTWWAADLRTCTVVGITTLIVAAALKVVFGRSGPDLTFVRDGVYEFRWLTGTWTPHHGAFPSATASVTSSIAAALWLRGSPLRVAAVVVAVVLSSAVVAQQYHWLSDAIAGSALGVAVAEVAMTRFVLGGLAGRAAETHTPL